MEHTLSEIRKLEPDNLTVHTLAIKRSSRLKQSLGSYELPDGDTVEKMVQLGMEYARSMDMAPYYMYRQKYMSGNLENVGYAKPDKVCMYNIDMMEETTSIMAHGAGCYDQAHIRWGMPRGAHTQPKGREHLYRKGAYSRR